MQRVDQKIEIFPGVALLPLAQPMKESSIPRARLVQSSGRPVKRRRRIDSDVIVLTRSRWRRAVDRDALRARRVAPLKTEQGLPASPSLTLSF